MEILCAFWLSVLSSIKMFAVILLYNLNLSGKYYVRTQTSEERKDSLMSTRSKKLAAIAVCLLSLSLAVGAVLLSPAMTSLEKQIRLQKCGVIGTPVRFESTDFDQVLCSKSEFIRMDSLPTLAEGTLLVGSAPISENQLIARADYDKISFVPTDDTVRFAAFTFSNATAKQSAVEVTCAVNLLNEVNLAPAVGAQSLTTGKDVSAFKFLKAADPENDAMQFEILSYPAHGTVKIAKNSDGYFSYTPQKGYTGTDSFSYTATDCYGNKSVPAKVTVTVTKAASDIDYADMTEHWAHNSALTISAQGLMSGVTDTETGKTLFLPNEPVSRGDFLAMALIAAGKESNIEFTAQTAFADDAAIPVNIKSYAAYAKEHGIVSGYTDEFGRTCFASASPITRSEAAVMIDRILSLPETSEDASAMTTFVDCSAVPTWADRSLSKVIGCGIFNGTGFGELMPAQTVTRAETAEILCNMQHYLAETDRVSQNAKSKSLWNLFGLLG